jgi:hypothetical protein
MPSHLRNGKELSFEQQRAAKRVAKRAKQIQQRAAKQKNTTNSPGAVVLSASVKQPSAAKIRSTAVCVRPISAADPPGAIGDSGLNKLPELSGYTLSPAALKRLR